MGRKKSANAKAVGAELAAVLTDIGPWYKQPHILRLNLCIISIMMCASANGYDGSMMNGLLALPQWHAFMNQPTGPWLGFLNAAYSLGNVLVYPAAAWVCNKYGRKVGIYISWVFLAIGTAVQTAAPNEGAFVAARFIIGCASGFFLSAPLLITENAYPTHRGVVSSLYNCKIHCSYPFDKSYTDSVKVCGMLELSSRLGVPSPRGISPSGLGECHPSCRSRSHFYQLRACF